MRSSRRLSRLAFPCLLSAALGLVLALSLQCAAQAAAILRARKIDSFDADWRFLKSDAKGAEAPEFDDSQWRKLDVPHDWSIEGPFDAHNPAGGAGAFLPGGVGWYRKHFATPAIGSSARVYIEFDGVMANSDVWINGYHLGKRPYGYVSFHYELTGHLNPPGKENLLAVRTDTSAQPASRWYEGAGIYRHVRLVAMAPVHLDEWGVAVSTPSVTDAAATVEVQSTLVDQSNYTGPVVVQTTLFDPTGAVAGIRATEVKVTAGEPATLRQDLPVAAPKRWDLNTPNLYRAWVQVLAGADRHPIDDEVVPFGIREFRLRSGNRLLAEWPEFQGQGRLPASGWRGVWHRGTVGCLGTAAEGAQGNRRQCHPHGA